MKYTIVRLPAPKTARTEKSGKPLVTVLPPRLPNVTRGKASSVVRREAHGGRVPSDADGLNAAERQELDLLAFGASRTKERRRDRADAIRRIAEFQLDRLVDDFNGRPTSSRRVQ